MTLALRHTDIRIQAERVWLDALLSYAPDVRGLIVIAAPYIGRLRDSRENHSAASLRDAGFGTLMISMLTPYEENRDPDVRFDVPLLHHRMQALLAWIDQQPQLTGLPIGILAIDTIASACVRLLSKEPERVSAVVTRSGRADLAGADPLRKLHVPTLMLMPGAETDLRAPSEHAYALIGGEKAWREFPDVSAGFIEPGALESSAAAARDWFTQHLPILPARSESGDPAPAIADEKRPQENPSS
ncbi:MAG TPA: alpha/beta hydrolase [Rhodocyclaceae bacterium]|nr:alpha/beta hydrolase [Rhodocyclaceae bacterium]